MESKPTHKQAQDAKDSCEGTPRTARTGIAKGNSTITTAAL